MIRLPLFGKDSLPQHTSSFLSLIITFVIWVILLVVFAFIKFPEKEEKYKPIQIVFEQPKVQSVKEKTVTEKKEVQTHKQEIIEQKTEEKPQIQQPKQEVVEQKKETKVEQKTQTSKKQPQQKQNVQTSKTTSAPKQSSQKAATTKKETPANKKVPEFTYAKSVEDLMNEQFETQKSTDVSDFDWDSMFEETSTSSSSNNSKKIVKTESSDFGQAGSLSYNENSNQTSKEVKASSNSALSSSTKSQLDNIAEAKQSSSSSKQTSSNQSLSKIDDFDWIQGSMRELQIPKDPKIIISEESGKSLDSTREVIISFTVLEDGSVINIKITPSSVLSPQIQSEIKEQLYNWHFESSSSISLASFRCILQKK